MLRYVPKATVMKTLSTKATGVLLLCAISTLLSHSAHCAEIRIMCPGAYVDALMELSPGFEGTTKHKLIIVRDGPINIANRTRAGELVDIVILPDNALNELIKEGYIASGSTRPLARSSIGMAVRA